MTMTKDEYEWALLRSGKLDEDLAAVKEEGEKVALFAQLRYLAQERGWKPGWAAHFYKSLYGSWPERGWEKVPPMRPTDETYRQVDRRQRSYGQEMKKYRDERRADDERRRGVEDGEVTGELYGSGESSAGVQDGGRVQGVEEPSECSGELRETEQ
jgi:hypothetical protein